MSFWLVVFIWLVVGETIVVCFLRSEVRNGHLPYVPTRDQMKPEYAVICMLFIGVWFAPLVFVGYLLVETWGSKPLQSLGGWVIKKLGGTP